ncbi:uncharacterized protein BJ171DRAFT_560984 [Polychytrium aggregatum]|uniref:uncharacterized protein n=1 Tax=Polychytrium aggregatum TaxID=110093 RepID=UPI0022FE095E|nr:uncharacterized protein BJ171DRAFT_560984 [Polychytrium aggregatum]KAI9209172.1 hypothetical protein BJ171DRAFT_560984 [Polychytrium aggregatum]
MSYHEVIPFLPGNTFRDVTKYDYRKPHSLDYVNGYAVQRAPLLGIGLTPLEERQLPSPEELMSTMGTDPKITYGSKQYHTKKLEPRFVPAHVAFDKVVLRFDGYFKQTVHESVEQFHLRKVRIHYFVEDDSISVVEPPVENSGIPQGVLIKRQRLPKSSTEYYTIRDFNLGINLTFYGKTFRITNCDQFTERYMRETEHIELNPPDKMPEDPHQFTRNRPRGMSRHKVEKIDKLQRFLEYDRMVLRFFCVWDDRESMFGELREFVLHYYLVDDCVEVREVRKPNNGRDPFPILLRRQQLPKSFDELSNATDCAKYTWKDFRIGGTINVLGRRFLIRDCDDYTKEYYAKNLGIPMYEMRAIPFDDGERRPQDGEIPPYNGFGSVEDSLGSCKYLVLKPPKKDFIKMLENEHKVLRFVARLDTRNKEDKGRLFVISYRLADDMMTIYEPPQRNAGIIGGKFMERTRVLKPGSSLSSPEGPSYYEASDLYVGAAIDVFHRRFILLDADEYVFNYMENFPHQFPFSDPRHVLSKAKAFIRGREGSIRTALEDRCQKIDLGHFKVERKALVDTMKCIWEGALTQHEAITLARQVEDENRLVDYRKLIALF